VRLDWSIPGYFECSMKPLFPEFIEPMTASISKEPFDHPDWIFETKLDGYRAIAVIDSAGKARIWSRNRLPLEPRFPIIGAAVNQLSLRSTILDGEIVALDSEGVPRFQLLSAMAEAPDHAGSLLPFRCALERGARSHR
jgi:ATP-dependent DNA ligase